MSRIPPDVSCQLAWGMASLEACRAGAEWIEPTHLMVAALRIIDGVHENDARALRLSGLSQPSLDELSSHARQILGLRPDELTKMRRSIRQTYLAPEHEKPPQLLHRSNKTKQIFKRAETLASIDGSRAVSMIHLLYALLQEPQKHLVDEDDIAAWNLPDSVAKPLRGEEDYLHPDEGRSMNRDDQLTPALNAIGRDLTDLARKNRLPEIVGRRDEILATAQHLMRVSKRNVLLVGNAGVGKTAIVEGLVQHAQRPGAPEELRSLRIVEIGIGNLIAGTRYRGDMEERLTIVIDEARNNPNTVLFIDEIHLAVKGGAAADSPLDVANILKPALARGDIRCIGATTSREYENHIKDDAAFMRRFQLVRVAEPSRDETEEICAAWARRIEAVQEIEIGSDAVVAAVELSSRWIRDRHLPDKAIDLLENAATRAKLSSLTFRGGAPSKKPIRLSKDDIEAAIEVQLGVSVGELQWIDEEKVREALTAKLIGQDDAISQVVDALRSIRLRVADAEGPLGVIMLTGPTGVGKTATADIVAKALTSNGGNRLARFNMNEYKERSDLSRLIGAPPGFVGHDRPGVLFQFVRENTPGVILLDEFEKANPELVDFFLQVFDTGEARDSRGELVDFRSQLFFITCNLAPDGPMHREMGFAKAPESYKKNETDHGWLRDAFGPEILGRIDRIVVYSELSPGDFMELFETHWRDLGARLKAEHVVEIRLEEESKQELIRGCSNHEEGARGFIHRFDQKVATPILDHVQYGKAHAETLLVSFEEGALKIRSQS